MKLPSRMLDLSVPLDNETVLDPPIMRPKIDYKTNKENAWMLLESFPGPARGGPARRRRLGVRAGAVHHAQRHPHGCAVSFPVEDHPRRADDDDRRGAARLVLPSRREARFPRAARRPRRHRGRGRGRAQAHRPRAQALRHRAGQHPRGELHRHRRISHRRLRHGPRGDALSHLARRARLRHRRLGLGRALRPHRASAGRRRTIPRSSGRGTRPAAKSPIATWRSSATSSSFRRTASPSPAFRTR